MFAASQTLACTMAAGPCGKKGCGGGGGNRAGACSKAITKGILQTARRNNHSPWFNRREKERQLASTGVLQVANPGMDVSSINQYLAWGFA